VALPLLAWLLVVMEIGPASSWNNFDITNHQPAFVKTITDITSFQIIELLSFVIKQSSLTLAKFLGKNICYLQYQINALSSHISWRIERNQFDVAEVRLYFYKLGQS
jgi:hypothetical protein